LIDQEKESEIHSNSTVLLAVFSYLKLHLPHFFGAIEV
jgi:hypothetical protein